MNAAKLLVPLLLVAVAGGGFLLLRGAEEPAAPTPAVREPQKSEANPKDPAPVVSETPREQEPPKPVRTLVPTITDQANTDAPQGVRGRVLTPGGAAAADLPVFLMKSATADPIEIFLQNKRGEVIPPLAAATTASDGTFALGLRRGGDNTKVDLRVISSDYPELHYRTVTVREGEWVETGDLKLEVGLVVQGHVLEESTKIPVRNAMVYLNSTNQTHTMLATPGREKGIASPVDGSGYFRFTNAPHDGSIQLAAEAPGYARTEKTNLQVNQENQQDFELELARGQPIAGIVTNATGQPLSGVSVIAAAISSKVPQTGQSLTGNDGRFEIPALREGPYQVTASAPQYEEKAAKDPVLAGTLDYHITLEQRGMAKLRVLSKQGAPVKTFTLQLKRSFPNNPLGIGNVPEFKDLRVNPGDFQGDWTLVRGIPNGDFVFQVSDDKHAKTLSPPFTIVAGGAVPEVEMQMSLGGSIRGRVLDDHGAPVAGANVSTDMNGGFAAETEFGQLFRQFMPDKITKKTTRTDAQGRFRLPLLAFGDYMIRAQHPEFCEGSQTEIKIETETDVDVPDLRLCRGAIVEGITTVGGQPGGQVKVVIGPLQGAPAEKDERGNMKNVFMANAISDSDGRFRFLKRVPPGSYTIHATKAAGDDNPFVKLLQVKSTQRQLDIGSGQEQSVQNFDIAGQ
ncbi:MAG TPA: carboxypeptidase regulatory-like domain-containing protein [Planctomycetota bacterium]|nr:carboxypeptidase regulatory-like domain-containing protein [Planctomycetota bacterium]